jgi:hypothetical protein
MGAAMVTPVDIERRLGECIDALYVSLGNPAQLPIAIDRLRELAGATGATYLHATPRAEITLYIPSGYDEGVMALYAQRYVEIDPAKEPMLAGKLGEWTCVDDTMLDPRKGWQREFVNDFAQRYGLRWIRSNKVLQTPERLAFFSVQRPSDAKTFTRQELQILEQLLPHLNRVSRLLLDPQFSVIRSGLAVLEHVQHAVLAVDGRASVHYANPAARHFLSSQASSRCGIRIRDGYLRVLGRGASRFDQALRLAGEKPRNRRFELATAARQASAFAIPFSSDAGPSQLQLRVAPLQDSLEQWMTFSQPLVLVFLSLASRCDRAGLQQMFGLTNAESELTELLVEGHRVEECASVRRVTIATVRSQIQS